MRIELNEIALREIERQQVAQGPVDRIEIQARAIRGDIGSGAIAKQTQMHKGFVITGINNVTIGSVNDLEQALAGSKNLQLAGFYPGYRGMFYYGLNNVDALSE